jgi:hypothetical protein
MAPPRRGRFRGARRLAGRARLATIVFLALSCSLGGGGGDGSTRAFRLGFTGFPHDVTVEAVDDAFAMIASDGDLTVYHFDNGVPWNEELAGDPHPDEANILWQRSLCPPEHKILLDVTPIAITRDGLAPFYGGAPLTAPWDGYAFDSPDVVTAYHNYCEQMIGLIGPDYFEFAIEANLLHELDSTGWAAFVDLATQTYASLKAAHPTLPIFMSLQNDHYWQHRSDPPNPTTGLTHEQALAQLFPSCDVVALSSYPVAVPADSHAKSLPDDWFDALPLLAPDKPFAIAETGWPAETVDAPYPVTLPSDEAEQRDYVDFLLERAQRRDALFVDWFLTWDYDDLWNSGAIAQDALNRFFRDIGLKDGSGRDRQALALWRDWVLRPYSRG